MRLRPYLTDPLASVAFVVGLAASFLYCRHLGAEYAQNQPFTQMVRAPQAINPTTGCSPTVEQMMAMCKAHAGLDKIIVVVGGNSVFLGIRQPVEDIWSKHLQEQLGDGYAVVNLAQRGQTAGGGAGSVAEALLKEGRKVIYLANMSLPDMGPPDGRHPYSYLFWNAKARGLLFPYPERDRNLDDVEAPFVNRPELKMRAALDRVSNAEDLWNSLSYTSFSTVWDVVPYNQSYRPRSESKDYEGPSPPLPQRFEGSVQHVLDDLKGVVAESQRFMVTTHLFQGEVDSGFVPQMRPRSVIVVTGYCPYFVRRAPADIRTRYEGFVRRAVQTFQQRGITSLEVGSDFEDQDFGDHLHFDPSGGRKLADRLAPEVRRIAHEQYGN